MEKPIIPYSWWIDGVYDTLKKEFPDKSDEDLRRFANELIIMANCAAMKMQIDRGEIVIPPDED